jgi:parvulin-like peptidyl-prolyl isomerase
VEQEKANTSALLGQSVQNLIDAELQSEIATQMGIVVTPADIDARLALEATTQEVRHISVMEFAPILATTETTATAAEIAEAKHKADFALAQLKSGVAWETVAKGTKGAGANNAGDEGFTEKDNSGLDPALNNALFSMTANGITDIIKGDDGTFRIGRLSGTIPQSIDANYQTSITSAGVSMDLYRKAVKADLIRKALQDKILADATTKPSEQRHVSEITLEQAVDQQTGAPILTDQVDSNHILYAPGTDISASPPPSTDPAWEVAHQRALATYYALLKDPTQFAAIAKRDSADTGSAADGGNLGYVSQTDLVKPFADAIFKPGLVKNQILPPVLSQYGWHVIQFVDRRAPAITRMQGFTLELAKPGTDFAAFAKANSSAADASKGGDMGWIAPYQLDPTLQTAIEKLAVGGVSDVVTSGTTLYIFKVTDIQTRLPDATQITALKTSAYPNWYAGEKAKANIDTDPAYAALSSSSPGG